jgi:hypothetical protein
MGKSTTRGGRSMTPKPDSVDRLPVGFEEEDLEQQRREPMRKLKILKELQELIPPLDPSELEQLHRELNSDCRAIHPLVVWKQEGVLVDGHHRYAYCQKMGFPFEVRRLTFTSIDAVKNHIILQQLGRRNLDGRQKDLLRGKLYNARKRKAHRPTHNSVKVTELNTAEQIAQETGASPRKVERDAKFADACDAISTMAEDGDITGEEKDQVMAKPKAQIIDAAKSPEAAKKAAKPKKKQPKKEPHKKVVEGFARLDHPQMKKAVSEIDKIWSSQ